MSENAKLFFRASVPISLVKAWMQYVRDFDTANPGCHFEIMLEDTGLTLPEMTEMLRVTPGLTFSKIVEREQT